MHETIGSNDLIGKQRSTLYENDAMHRALNVNNMGEIARIEMNDSNDTSQPRMVKSGSDASIDGAGPCHYFRE